MAWPLKSWKSHTDRESCHDDDYLGLLMLQKQHVVRRQPTHHRTPVPRSLSPQEAIWLATRPRSLVESSGEVFSAREKVEFCVWISKATTVSLCYFE